MLSGFRTRRTHTNLRRYSGADQQRFASPPCSGTFGARAPAHPVRGSMEDVETIGLDETSPVVTHSTPRLFPQRLAFHAHVHISRTLTAVPMMDS
jgi:hypothetical protein